MRTTGETGARSGGRLGSLVPAGTTVTRRAFNVSAASGVTRPPGSSSTVDPGSIRRASASLIRENRSTATSTPGHHANVGQISVVLVHIESVADDESIVDGKTDVLHFHVDFA